ncbi:MAG: ketopantoate reductase family protein [bacterium]|nr:ketopantoate reductase family protein [bacterium]
MDETLIIGAGVTGYYTAARLSEKGVNVTLLARGEKADRLERDGLRMRDGLSGDERTVRLRVIRAPVTQTFDLAMVCVQEVHRAGIEPLLKELPGTPIVWFLGNTSKGFDRLGKLLGRERVLGGFPGVGGTWEEDVLVYADRQRSADPPFDKLVIGEAFPEGAPAAEAVETRLVRVGMNVEHHVPIMAWHWSHLALVLPLAGAVYRHDRNLHAVVADVPLLKQTMRATSQALAAVRRAGYPIRPRGLGALRWIPTPLGARRIGALLDSRFGQIALAGHATAAREEIHAFASDFLALAGDDAGADLRALMAGI